MTCPPTTREYDWYGVRAMYLSAQRAYLEKWRANRRAAMRGRL